MTRMAFVALVGLVLGVTSACVTDMEQDAKIESVESAVTISPVAGSWDYTEISSVSGTCNAKFKQFEDGAFTIDTVTATSFRIVPRNGTPPFTCNTNTAGGFTCPNRATLSLSFRPLVDISLTMRATATGLFAHNRQATGKQDLVITCSGSACPLVGPSPCGYVVNFNVRKL